MKAGGGLVDRLCRLRLRALAGPDIGAPKHGLPPDLADAAKKPRVPLLINVGTILGKPYPPKVNLENQIEFVVIGDFLSTQFQNNVFALAEISIEYRAEFKVVLYKTGVHCIVFVIDKLTSVVQSIGHFKLEEESSMDIENGTYRTLNSAQMMGELKDANDALAMLTDKITKYRASNSKQTQRAKLDADRERTRQDFENANRTVKSEASVIYERDIESIKSKIAQETEQVKTKLAAELEPIKTKLANDLEDLAKEFKETQARLREESLGAQAKLREDAERSKDELKASQKPAMDESKAIYKKKIDALESMLSQELKELETEAATRQAAIASNTASMQAQETEQNAKKLKNTYTKIVRRGPARNTNKATSKVAKNVAYQGGGAEQVAELASDDDEGRPATSSPQAGSGSSNEPMNMDDD